MPNEKELPKTEDILLEIDLKTLNEWNDALRRAEDKLVDSLMALRFTRNQIHNLQFDHIKGTMRSNEEKISSLEEDMSNSIEALKELEEKADTYKAGFEESQRLLADEARNSETRTDLLNEAKEDDEPCQD